MKLLCRLWMAVLVASLAACGGGAWDIYAGNWDWSVTPAPAGNSTAPAMATLSNGDLAMAWHFLGSDGKSFEVHLQRFDANGGHIGSEKTVNRSTIARAARPAIAPLNDGGYVVAWSAADLSALYVQRFDAADNRVGDERRVSSSLPLDASSDFGVAALNDGGYVLAWVAVDGAVFSRRFHDAGDPDAEARLDPLEATARSALVAALADGGWVIAWTHLHPGGGGIADIYAQRFDASGAKRDRTFTVNASASAFQSLGGLAGLKSGRYVAVWSVRGAQAGSTPAAGVYAQCFDPGGGRVASQTRVNATTAPQARPTAAALKDGGYIVAWESLPAGSSTWDVSAQRFDAGARTSGGVLLVNPDSGANAQQVAAAGSDDGGYTFAWTSSKQGSTSAIDMARYGSNNRPR